MSTSRVSTSSLILLIVLFLATFFVASVGTPLVSRSAGQIPNLSQLDFSLSASNPSPASVTPGGSATSTVTLQSTTGIGSVDLSANGCSNGLSCQFSPNPVQVSALSSSTSTLTITTSSSTPTGSYTITVVGTCLSTTCTSPPQSASISLTVTGDFSVSASPSSLDIPLGSSQKSQFTLTSMDGFAGRIDLSSSTTSPSLSMTCDSSQLHLTAGGASSLSCSFTPSSLGSYTGTVTASYGSLSHSASVSVVARTQPDFILSASPSSLDVPVGSSQSSQITFTSQNAFAGTVDLSSSTTSANLSMSCYASQINLAAGGTAYVTCTFTPSALGSYAGTETAASGILSHSASVTVVANTEPDFTISASPQSFFVQTGLTNSTILTLTGVNNFNGQVILGSSNSNATLSNTMVTLSPGVSATATLNVTGSDTGTFQVTVTAASKSLTHSTIVTVAVWDFRISGPSSIETTAGVTGTGSISVVSSGGFSGSVSLSLVAPQGVQATLTSNQVSLTAYQRASTGLKVSSRLAGTFSVVVVGSNRQLSHSASILVTVSDFTVTTSPSSVAVFAGESVFSTVILTSLNGFCCNVVLSASASGAGISTGFTSNPVAVPKDGNANSTLTITIDKSAPSGSYLIKVVANSTGGALHTARMAVTIVTDFTISMNPGSLSIPVGASTTSRVTITGARNFADNINLSATTSGNGVLLTFSQETVVLTGQPATVTLTASSSQDALTGIYSITIVASSSTMSHNVSIALVLTPAPQISVPHSQTVYAGSPLVFKVNATDADTSKIITLSVSTPLPPGATFTTASYVGTVTGIFNWIPSLARDVGGHNITFTVTDGHGGRVSASVLVSVLSGAKPNASAGFLWYSILGVGGTGAGLAVLSFLRKRVRLSVRRLAALILEC